MESKEKLGKFARDIVSNFQGTITAVCFYWGGNVRIGIMCKGDAKEEWFDEVRVEIIKEPDFPKDRKESDKYPN